MDLQGIPGMLVKLVLLAWQKMLSLRASGTSFDPEIIERKGDMFVVLIHVFPGSDEVLFRKLQVKGFDISHGSAKFGEAGLYDFHQDGGWSKDEMPLKVIVPPKTRRAAEEALIVVIRPRTPCEKAKFVLSGGFLNRLSASRFLP